MTIEYDNGQWAFETDVVVVGSGGCGLTAALAAAQGGVEVLVLEKQERPLSNTARSYGIIPAGGTRFQRAAGVEETPEDFAADIRAKNKGQSDEALTLHLCRTAVDLVHWLVDDVGATLHFVDDFTYPGHSRHRMHAPPNRSGAELHADLRRAAAANPNIDIVNDSPAVELVTDDEGAVCGVIVQRGEHDGPRERVKAKKVILATNGFGANKAMLRRYIPEMENALYLGGEGNTGDGIAWGMALSAATAFMDAYQAHGSVAVPYNILITYAIVAEGGIQVNKYGQRFGTELQGYSERALEVLSQPDGLAWMIYPERLHRLGMTFEEYRSAHEAGAIHIVSTAEELASTLGIDPEGLAQTLHAYNAAADGQAPDPLGRAICKRIDPPYHAVKVTGALFHTQGGLVVDLNAQVLRPDGSPIPNLYAGGGTAAGISGYGPAGYLSGNGLLAALSHGLLAGRHAAKSIAQTHSSANAALD
jgi:fumarate reductase flavoprotein subunit